MPDLAAAALGAAAAGAAAFSRSTALAAEPALAAGAALPAAAVRRAPQQVRVASRLEHHPAHNRPRRPPPPPFSAGRYANLQPSSGGWRGSTLDPQAFIHSHGDDPYEYEEKYGSPVQLIRIFRNNGADTITDEYKEWACATGLPEGNLNMFGSHE